MQISIPIIGQSYAHTDQELSNQSRKNWLVEVNRETLETISLQPFPGYTAFYSGTGLDGGMAVFNNELYKVSDTTLYKISSLGVASTIGTIAGSGLCSFGTNGSELLILRGGNVYSTTGTSVTLATDSDLESPDYVTVINNQALYNGTSRRFAVSDAGNLTSVNGLNYASKESRPGDLIRPYAFKEMVYLFGEGSIEQWWNSGVGNPPFDRIQGGLIERGLLAPKSVANNENYVYFLGDDYVIYRMAGSQVQPVSTIPITQDIKTYSSRSSAVGFCYTLEGQNHYQIYFPNEKTWVYKEVSNSWIELTTTYKQTEYPATSYAEAYSKQFIAVGGSVYYFDKNAYTNNGDVIVRETTTGAINAGMISPDLYGKKMEMSYFRIKARVNGLTTGQGSAPTVMFRYSDDFGATWSSERMMSAKPISAYEWDLTARRLGSFVNRIFKITFSDPCFCSIHRANAWVTLGVD